MRRVRAGNSKRPPKESRTIALKGNKERGEGLDYGRWYECWNCGFKCNVDRDALGGSASRSGVVIEDYVDLVDRRYESAGPYSMTQDNSINHFHVILANGPDGQPQGVRHSHRVSESTTGCPFCGTKNWRGDY